MKTALTLFAALLIAGWSQAAPVSPYAGQQTRDIKSLSETEIADLLAGRGMGLAKAAELNGYPGPAHVLELSGALGLTPEQIRRTQAVFEHMQASAKTYGAQLVEAERALEMQFREGAMSASSLSE